MLANVGGELNHANDEYFMRVVRKWFKVEKNRQQFFKDLDGHLNTGVSFNSHMFYILFVERKTVLSSISGCLSWMPKHI